VAAPLKFLNVRAVRQRINPETRRAEVVDPPQVVLTLATEKGVLREVPLDAQALARLLAQAADANAVLAGVS